MRAKDSRKVKLVAAVALLLGAAAFCAVRFQYPPFVARLWERLRYERGLRRINSALERQLASRRPSSFLVRVPGETDPAMRSVEIANVGRRTVRDLWLWVEGKPNFYNLEALNRSIMRPGMSDREKALAVFEFLKDFPCWSLPGGPQSADAIRAFAVDGHGWCDTKSRNAAAMLELEGVRVRQVALPGQHVAIEFYDGRAGKWSFIDFDRLCFFPGEGGALLSYRELAEQARARPELREDEYFRIFYGSEGDARIPRERSDYGGFLEGRVEGLDHRGVPFDETVRYWDHTMSFTLRPAESVRLRWERGGRYFAEQHPEIEGNLLPRDRRAGGAAFSNGSVEWRPDVQKLNGFLERKAFPRRTGVGCLRRRGAASFVFPYQSPHVIVGGAVDLAARTKGTLRLYYWKPPEHYPLYQMRRRQIGGLLDVTRRWKLLWEHTGDWEGTVSLDPLFRLTGDRASDIPHYEGVLKLECPDGATELEAFTLRLVIQSSMFGLRSLELARGDNVINLYGRPVREVSYGADGEATCATAQNESVRVRFTYEVPGREAAPP